MPKQQQRENAPGAPRDKSEAKCTTCKNMQTCDVTASIACSACKVHKELKHFKLHFELAQYNLQKFCFPTMKSGALLQQANTISKLVLENMKEERNEYLNAIQATKNIIVQALGSSIPPTIDKNNNGVK